jgi:AcrR family transcriptional regulator
MSKGATRQRRTHNREATEQALLDACGKLLLESGPEGIGVNRVAAEASVGKELIYRYFDGLPGLIKAWLERDANWPTIAELTTPDKGGTASPAVTQQTQTICRNYILALRKRPVIMRILVSQIMNPSDVTAILEEAGDRIGRELYQSLQLSGNKLSNDVVDISLIFTIVSNYLCMRALTSPNAFGMNLEDDASWDRIQRILDTVIERYLQNA